MGHGLKVMEAESFEVNLDNQYILSKHKIIVDNRLKSLDSPEGRKKYAKHVMKQIMHDDVEVGSVKLKRPNILKRGALKLAGKPAKAYLYVTTKF
jgi:hypothetical protein